MEIAPEVTRTRRHPTDSNPSRSTVDPNAPVTIQCTNVLETAVYLYLLGTAALQRVERFSLDTLRFELRVTRAERETVNALLKDDTATLSLKIFAERVQELNALSEKVRLGSGVWQAT